MNEALRSEYRGRLHALLDDVVDGKTDADWFTRIGMPAPPVESALALIEMTICSQLGRAWSEDLRRYARDQAARELAALRRIGRGFPAPSRRAPAIPQPQDSGPHSAARARLRALLDDVVDGKADAGWFARLGMPMPPLESSLALIEQAMRVQLGRVRPMEEAAIQAQLPTQRFAERGLRDALLQNDIDATIRPQ